MLNKPSTCYLLTQSPQQSWVGSNAYYHFATRKLRLREVKWLTPCHTELRFHTQDSARAPDLNLDIILALSDGEGVLTMAKGFILSRVWGFGIMTQFPLNRELEIFYLGR